MKKIFVITHVALSLLFGVSSINPMKQTTKLHFDYKALLFQEIQEFKAVVDLIVEKHNIAARDGIDNRKEIKHIIDNLLAKNIDGIIFNCQKICGKKNFSEEELKFCTSPLKEKYLNFLNGKTLPSSVSSIDCLKCAFVFLRIGIEVILKDTPNYLSAYGCQNIAQFIALWARDIQEQHLLQDELNEDGIFLPNSKGDLTAKKASSMTIEVMDSPSPSNNVQQKAVQPNDAKTAATKDASEDDDEMPPLLTQAGQPVKASDKAEKQAEVTAQANGTTQSPTQPASTKASEAPNAERAQTKNNPKETEVKAPAIDLPVQRNEIAETNVASEDDDELPPLLTQTGQPVKASDKAEKQAEVNVQATSATPREAQPATTTSPETSNAGQVQAKNNAQTSDDGAAKSELQSKDEKVKKDKETEEVNKVRQEPIRHQSAIAVADPVLLNPIMNGISPLTFATPVPLPAESSKALTPTEQAEAMATVLAINHHANLLRAIVAYYNSFDTFSRLQSSFEKVGSVIEKKRNSAFNDVWYSRDRVALFLANIGKNNSYFIEHDISIVGRSINAIMLNHFKKVEKLALSKIGTGYMSRDEFGNNFLNVRPCLDKIKIADLLIDIIRAHADVQGSKESIDFKRFEKLQSLRNEIIKKETEFLEHCLKAGILEESHPYWDATTTILDWAYTYYNVPLISNYVAERQKRKQNAAVSQSPKTQQENGQTPKSETSLERRKRLRAEKKQKQVDNGGRPSSAPLTQNNEALNNAGQMKKEQKANGNLASEATVSVTKAKKTKRLKTAQLAEERPQTEPVHQDTTKQLANETDAPVAEAPTHELQQSQNSSQQSSESHKNEQSNPKKAKKNQPTNNDGPATFKRPEKSWERVKREEARQKWSKSPEEREAEEYAWEVVARLKIEEENDWLQAFYDAKKRFMENPKEAVSFDIKNTRKKVFQAWMNRAKKVKNARESREWQAKLKEADEFYEKNHSKHLLLQAFRGWKEVVDEEYEKKLENKRLAREARERMRKNIETADSFRKIRLLERPFAALQQNRKENVIERHQAAEQAERLKQEEKRLKEEKEQRAKELEEKTRQAEKLRQDQERRKEQERVKETTRLRKQDEIKRRIAICDEQNVKATKSAFTTWKEFVAAKRKTAQTISGKSEPQQTQTREEIWDEFIQATLCARGNADLETVRRLVPHVLKITDSDNH